MAKTTKKAAKKTAAKKPAVNKKAVEKPEDNVVEKPKEEIKPPVKVESKKEVREVPVPDPTLQTVTAGQVVRKMETAVALKTTRKFLGAWYNLKAGEEVTAPKEVIDTLRRGEFVK